MNNSIYRVHVHSRIQKRGKAGKEKTKNEAATDENQRLTEYRERRVKESEDEDERGRRREIKEGRREGGCYSE